MRTPIERNDEYLALIERLNLCPFAKRCREMGRLERRVLAGAGAELLQAARKAVGSIEAVPAGSIEVALLICPDFAAGSRAFEEFCLEVRKSCHTFFCVAFHPELPEDLADAHRAVGFVRRSPDPTLQLVNAAVLERVRGEQGSIFVDAKKLTLDELKALKPPASVSDQIASNNLATIRREGPEVLREALETIRRR